MKILKIVLVAIIVAACDSSSKYEEKYDSGEIKLTGTIDSKGHRVGTWWQYDIYGNIAKKYFYRLDTLYLQETYSENLLLHKEEMLGEIKHGMTWTYHKSGNLESSFEFLNGVQLGEAKEYYENGQIKMETTYGEDGPGGIFRQYYPNGVINVEVLEYGNDTVRFYDKSGKLKMSVLYEDYTPTDTTFLEEDAIEVLTEDMKLMNLPR